MEGMPLKYIAMLIIAAIIVTAMVNITGTLTATTITGMETANSTLQEVLQHSMGNALKVNVTP
jgi:archaellin